MFKRVIQPRLSVILNKAFYSAKSLPNSSIQGKKEQQPIPDDETPLIQPTKLIIVLHRILIFLSGDIPRTRNEMVYFFPDKNNSKIEIINAEEYQEFFQEADVSEKINEVRYYIHPLYRWQLSKYFLHRAFLVLKTDNWWWSIEKDEREVTIQKFKHLENVRDKFQRQNRVTGVWTGINLVKTAPSGHVNMTVKELVDLLWRGNHMNSYKEKNGKHFANYIYDTLFSP